VPDELARALGDRVRAAAPRLGGTRLACVDGPAGSGKTTLADALGVALDAQVVHLDDLYQGWGGLPGMLPRLRHWVLEPLAAGRAGRYRRWDWDAEAWAEWRDVPVADALVVEGVGAAQAGVREHAVLTAWVEAPWELRLRRGVGRDGEGMRPEWERWQAAEAAHFAADGTAAAADVVIDGTGTAAPVWRVRDR
jgi:cytidylate kinase